MIVEDIRSDTPDAQIIVAGDFNARSPAWGDKRRNDRGNPLKMWMDGLGLQLLNRGSTCVRPQEGSVLDITMAFPSAAQGAGWRVVLDMREETLSDHCYIEVVMGTARQPVLRPSMGGARYGPSLKLTRRGLRPHFWRSRGASGRERRGETSTKRWNGYGTAYSASAMTRCLGSSPTPLVELRIGGWTS